MFGPSLAAGRSRRSPDLAPLEIAAGGPLAITEDREEATRLRNLARPHLALYIGGMGARGQNFYNALVCRYGWEGEAATIQDLYLSGRKAEAEAAVPDALLEQTSLIGPESYIKERIDAYREAGVTVLNIVPIGPDHAQDISRVKHHVV